MDPLDFLNATRMSVFGADPNLVPQQAVGVGDGNPQPSQWVQYPPPPTQNITAASDVLAPYIVVAVTPTSGITLTSQPSMTAGWMGQIVMIGNFGAYNLTLKHGSGTYGFRLTGAADLTIPPNAFVTFMYVTNSGWVQIAPLVQT